MAKKKTRKPTSSPTKTIHRWTCPKEKVFLLKAETILLAVFVFLIFIFSYLTFDQQWFPTTLATLLFILIFVSIIHLLRIYYPIQETYHLTSTHLQIHHHAGKKTTKTKIPHSQIKNLKTDKLLHGGRIETSKGYHPLFFNSKHEIEKLEKHLKKKIKR